MNPRAALLALVDAANWWDLESIQDIAEHPRVTESFRRLLTAFPDVRIDVEWTIAEGDRAAGWAAIRGTHDGEWRGLPASGKPIDVRGMLAVQTNSDGGVADFWVANDWLSIAMQIGVPLTLPSES